MARSMQKRRQFMTESLDEDKAPRMAPALLAVRDLLCDLEWHSHEELINEALAESDLAVDTIKSRICEAVAVGFIDKRGKWTPRRGSWPKKVTPSSDTREYRLVDWPLPW